MILNQRVAALFLATKKAQADEAVRALQDKLVAFRSGLITQDELERATADANALAGELDKYV